MVDVARHAWGVVANDYTNRVFAYVLNCVRVLTSRAIMPKL
jgi:hypothetical protein